MTEALASFQPAMTSWPPGRREDEMQIEPSDVTTGIPAPGGTNGRLIQAVGLIWFGVPALTGAVSGAVAAEEKATSPKGRGPPVWQASVHAQRSGGDASTLFGAEEMMDDLKYPIGKFVAPAALTAEDRARLIGELREAPARLRGAVAGLREAQLDTPYRPGGWTVRQVVHHLPDSHLNAYLRFRLALTEEQPAIKPYDEARWAELADARSGPVEVSLDLLAALHTRWVALLESLSAGQWARVYRHPDLGAVGLEKGLALYAWHGRHHVAHVTSLRERSGWRS